jgi:small-conductance mechanosensitive channel
MNPQSANLPFSATVWMWTIIIGLPLSLVALTEIVLDLRRRGHPLTDTLAFVRTFLLPALAFALYMTEVVGGGLNNVYSRFARTLLWTFLIYAALKMINDLVFGHAAEESWQARTPKVLRDLIRLLLVLGGLAIVLSRVWGWDLSTLIKTLGVTSIVIGLALQEPLGQVFSGILLLLDRPINVGEYIDAGGQIGKIVDINWRTVHLELVKGERLIVPNGVLAKGSLRNFSRPTPRYTEVLSVRFSYKDPPGHVKRILLDILNQMEGILRDPPPVVQTSGYQGDGINYEVRFTVEDYTLTDEARDEFLTRLWYASERAGLTTPNAVPMQKEEERARFELWRTEKPAALLGAFPLFGIHDAEEMGCAAAQIAVRVFTQGEVMIAEGKRSADLYLIVTGAASLSVRDRGGIPREIARLARGDFFGEGSLLSGQASEVTATALADTVTLALDKEAMRALFERTPHLASEISHVMDVRRKATETVRSLRPKAAAGGNGTS